MAYIKWVWGDVMPRKARVKSSSSIYHIIMRGINRQSIFEDEEDYRKFLQTLRDYKEICGYLIFAYCLMGNHVPPELQNMERQRRNACLKKLKNDYNLSVRQIARLTGIGRGVVFKA
jgi:REP element-mobilizing transposase RayT